MRSPDSATNRRDAADVDTPAPVGAGTSPSGRRTVRQNFRVETLISIRLMAHLPSQSSDIAACQLGKAISPNLPQDTGLDRLVDLAKLRCRIERDYQELKQELGFGDYERRGWPASTITQHSGSPPMAS